MDRKTLKEKPMDPSDLLHPMNPLNPIWDSDTKTTVIKAVVQGEADPTMFYVIAAMFLIAFMLTFLCMLVCERFGIKN